MKSIFVCILLAAGLAFSQTATPPATPASPATGSDAKTAAAVSALSSITLPTYVAAGGAYNQFAGVNLWASAVVPVSNSAGIYESTTADLFPVKATINGKSAYVFLTSVREGVHRVISNNGKFMLLGGADAGYAFTSSAASTPVTAPAVSSLPSSGVSAAITITAVWQISNSLAVMFPVRALYMPTVGGWNPIAEFGLVWKPGAK